jgi:single-stranded-DNA-specific exonuclease
LDDMTLDHAIDHAGQILLQASRDQGRVALVYHADADGISSAALLANALEKAGASIAPCTPEKGQNVYDGAFQQGLHGLAPQATVLLDTGARAHAELGPKPAIVIDHHATAAPPAVDCFVHDATCAATSLLALRVAERIAAVDDHTWLVAVGLLGDLGDAARRHPAAGPHIARHGLKSFQEIAALVNASGRASTPRPEVAFRALHEASTPRALLQADSKELAQLRAMRSEVAAAITRARRVAPRVRGRWAIIELDEPCRVHGVIASAWVRRLAPRIVLVANRGYMPGRVHFSVRAQGDVDLRAALRALLPDESDDYAAGHARASGGVVDGETYERLSAAIAREAA